MAGARPGTGAGRALDGAILDINLHGDMSFAIAEVLRPQRTIHLRHRVQAAASFGVPLGAAANSQWPTERLISDGGALRPAPKRPTGGHGIVGRACRWRAICMRR
jgi:hypothetical protein